MCFKALFSRKRPLGFFYNLSVYLVCGVFQTTEPYSEMDLTIAQKDAY